MYLGEIFGLLTALCWAIGSMSFAAAAAQIGATYVNLTRLLLASMVLTLVVFLVNGIATISTHHILYFALSGLVGFGFGDTFLFRAYETIGARVSMVIMSFAPAVAAILGYIFIGERIPLLGVLGICITIAGITIVVLERSRTAQYQRKALIGVLWAFLGALGQAGGVVLSKLGFQSGPITGLQATFIRLVAAAIVVIPLNMLLGKFSEPLRRLHTTNALKFVLLGTLFGPILGVTFSLLSIHHTEVAVASTLMATTPLFMIPLVKIVHREKIHWQAVLGAFLAVGGITLLFVR
ncbi:MAG: DMT family transporter [Bacteroidetes bacterium]|nr:DMT family transporter [Bacteroidota bacterium]